MPFIGFLSSQSPPEENTDSNDSGSYPWDYSDANDNTGGVLARHIEL